MGSKNMYSRKMYALLECLYIFIRFWEVSNEDETEFMIVKM